MSYPFWTSVISKTIKIPALWRGPVDAPNHFHMLTGEEFFFFQELSSPEFFSKDYFDELYISLSIFSRSLPTICSVYKFNSRGDNIQSNIYAYFFKHTQHSWWLARSIINLFAKMTSRVSKSPRNSNWVSPNLSWYYSGMENLGKILWVWLIKLIAPKSLQVCYESVW